MLTTAVTGFCSLPHLDFSTFNCQVPERLATCAQLVPNEKTIKSGIVLVNTMVFSPSQLGV
jgi:hypothetical protein